MYHGFFLEKCWLLNISFIPTHSFIHSYVIHYLLHRKLLVPVLIIHSLIHSYTHKSLFIYFVISFSKTVDCLIDNSFTHSFIRSYVTHYLLHDCNLMFPIFKCSYTCLMCFISKEQYQIVYIALPQNDYIIIMFNSCCIHV